jgi:hypothetical protein
VNLNALWQWGLVSQISAQFVEMRHILYYHVPRPGLNSECVYFVHGKRNCIFLVFQPSTVAKRVLKSGVSYISYIFDIFLVLPIIIVTRFYCWVFVFFDFSSNQSVERQKRLLEFCCWRSFHRSLGCIPKSKTLSFRCSCGILCYSLRNCSLLL